MLRLARTLTLGAIRGMASFINKFSMSFDGIQENLQTTADDTAQPTTYSFWCKASTTGENRGVFGHGGLTIGAFHFNYSSNRPLLIFNGTDSFMYWNDNSAQDDGEWHHWVVYADPNNITNSKLYVDGVLQTVDQSSVGTVTPYTEPLTIGADQQNGGNHFEGQIDEFAVYHKELSQAEIDVLYNTYYRDNTVQNGDFEEIGAEEVTNGTFDTDSDWNKLNGSTISGGVGNVIANGNLSSTGNNWSLNQNVGMLVGKTYKISFKAKQTGGTGNFQVSQGYLVGFNQSITSSFVDYSFNITAADWSGNTGIVALGGLTVGDTFEVDNVSVKEVGQHWNQSGTWNSTNYVEFNGSSARLVTDGTGVGVKQTPMVVGREYKLTFDVIAAALGSAKFDGASINFSSVGSYSTTFTAAQTSLAFFRNSGAADITIDNVVLQELKHKATNLLKDSGDYTSSADLEHYYRMGDGKLDSYPTIFDQKGSDNATMTNMSSGNILQDTPVTS